MLFNVLSLTSLLAETLEKQIVQALTPDKFLSNLLDNTLLENILLMILKFQISQTKMVCMKYQLEKLFLKIQI